jgi:hypothetical protein
MRRLIAVSIAIALKRLHRITAVLTSESKTAMYQDLLSIPRPPPTGFSTYSRPSRLRLNPPFHDRSPARRHVTNLGNFVDKKPSTLSSFVFLLDRHYIVTRLRKKRKNLIQQLSQKSHNGFSTAPHPQVLKKISANFCIAIERLMDPRYGTSKRERI